MFRVCCISDTHGYLPMIDECDLLIHAGDLTPVFDHSETFQLSWVSTNFNHWLKEAPAKRKVVVAGNHDFLFEKMHNYILDKLIDSLDCDYLLDSGVEIGGYKIWGSPWQPPFYDWAFNLPENKLAEHWEMIPDDTDILVTHGPPRNIRDREGRNEEHVGSKTLLERTWKLPELKLHVFGHVHHDYGQVEIAEAQFVNACYVDESYRPVHEPIYIDLPNR